MIYANPVRCPADGCAWSHEALDEDDAVLAWQFHAEGSGCPQPAAEEAPDVKPSGPGTDFGPDDPALTVRAADGVLAVRAPASSLNADDDTEQLAWFIINGAAELPDLEVDELAALIATWPIVYQPGTHALVSHDGEIVALLPAD